MPWTRPWCSSPSADGPLAQNLDLTQGQTACVVNRVAGLSSLIPEVSRIVFAQGEGKRSALLRQVIADCKASSRSTT
jgi:hypothetical protein